MRIALVGATGLVGQTMLDTLVELDFPVTELIPVASAQSVGKTILFKGQAVVVQSMEAAIAARPDLAIFSAGGSTALQFAPQFAAVGTMVIDNSSAFRMDADVPLIVPEVNLSHLQPQHRIIANPNCSTIQMVVALNPLHQAYGLDRLVISTYQSITGTGMKAVKQYEAEKAGLKPEDPAYPHTIFANCLPHCDVFLENDYTKEEMKLVNETKKILGDASLRITATAVRVPTLGGHSESINASFHRDFELAEVRQLLASAPGLILMDEPKKNIYPMPLLAKDRNEVFVGRVRRDESAPNTLNLWVVADNLRKGAATNAVQIALHLAKSGWKVQ